MGLLLCKRVPHVGHTVLHDSVSSVTSIPDTQVSDGEDPRTQTPSQVVVRSVTMMMAMTPQPPLMTTPSVPGTFLYVLCVLIR